jgi:hypothetical protein
MPGTGGRAIVEACRVPGRESTASTAGAGRSVMTATGKGAAVAGAASAPGKQHDRLDVAGVGGGVLRPAQPGVQVSSGSGLTRRPKVALGIAGSSPKAASAPGRRVLARISAECFQAPTNAWTGARRLIVLIAL